MAFICVNTERVYERLLNNCLSSRRLDLKDNRRDSEHLMDTRPTSKRCLYMARMFRTILCVGTGSGIAPILGLLILPNLKFRILWSAPDPERTFGADIMRRALGADSDAVIWDTKQQGRPNLVAETKHIYDEGDTEAVFVVSNAKVTADVVFGLES